jgi:hypothetical protein
MRGMWLIAMLSMLAGLVVVPLAVWASLGPGYSYPEVDCGRCVGGFSIATALETLGLVLALLYWRSGGPNGL